MTDAKDKPIALGIIFGVTFGIVFDNIALGLCFGVVFGVLFSQRTKDLEEEEGDKDGQTH